jgi:hypothetical protein
MSDQRSSAWSFTLSFRQHLFAAMSGGASVPFTALAIYLDNKWAQVIFLVCALTCAWFAAYRVWKPERERADELEKKLIPEESDIDIALRDGWAYESGLVDAEGRSLPPARTFVVRISNRGGKFLEKCQITFGPKQSNPHFSYP